jgi:ankyrin repeat protein
MLLKSGADPDEPDENGETALHIACRYGQHKLVKIFLEDAASAIAVSKVIVNKFIIK